MSRTPQINAVCMTDTGLVREQNEDVCHVCHDDHFVVLADGIGGALGGEVASRMFLQKAAETFRGSAMRSRKETTALIKRSFTRTNDGILQHVQSHPAHAGMGCTAELFALGGDDFVVGHVGDSRTYYFDGGILQRLTTDHTLVQEQLALGIIQPDQAEASRAANVLTRAVGAEAQLSIDMHYGKLQPGAIVLLCSDGLYNMVKDNEILPVLQYEAPLALRAEVLITMANAAGGRDNVSVALVELGGG